MARFKEADCDELVRKLPEGAVLLPVQTVGELFNLLVHKAERAPEKARKAILSWKDAFPLIETSAEVMVAAADLATDHQLSIWDSVTLSAAADGRLPTSPVRRFRGGVHLEGSHRHESILDS